MNEEISPAKKQKFIEYIEQVLFDRERLEKLKHVIQQVCAGKVEDRPIREYILRERVFMLQRLTSLIPYFVRTKLEKHISHTSGKNTNDYEKLLEEIGQRINNLYIKLEENLSQER